MKTSIPRRRADFITDRRVTAANDLTAPIGPSASARGRLAMIDTQDLLGGPQASGGDVLDCVVVGGGPAGLTAGMYLRRFHRTVRVVDAGSSRARLITRSHNVAGFPDGVAGGHLLEKMKQHLRQVGGHLCYDTVEQIRIRDAGLFAVGLTHELLWARNLMLCTGVKDRLPELPGLDGVAAAGLLRHCPVCDAFEFTGKRIGVLGNSKHGVKEAAFLRHFSKDTWFVEIDGRLDDLSADIDLHRLRQLPGVARHVAVNHDRQAFVTLDDGSGHRFDVLYAALGVDPRTQLARSLGVVLDENGTIVTDAHGRTSVSNVYAAGDVVRALDQIAVALGHAAIAATAIHNHLSQVHAGGSRPAR
ncbi:MAG: NAD(P)/FAD-dependent oxidoreductase [Burkholderiales bacterium]|nr:MAG: NAD(P)/FAD-dependent oxidoreductase [Burkholderiales bacterium]